MFHFHCLQECQCVFQFFRGLASTQTRVETHSIWSSYTTFFDAKGKQLNGRLPTARSLQGRQQCVQKHRVCSQPLAPKIWKKMETPRPTLCLLRWHRRDGRVEQDRGGLCFLQHLEGQKPRKRTQHGTKSMGICTEVSNHSPWQEMQHFRPGFVIRCRTYNYIRWYQRWLKKIQPCLPKQTNRLLPTLSAASLQSTTTTDCINLQMDRLQLIQSNQCLHMSDTSCMHVFACPHFFNLLYMPKKNCSSTWNSTNEPRSNGCNVRAPDQQWKTCLVKSEMLLSLTTHFNRFQHISTGPTQRTCIVLVIFFNTSVWGGCARHIAVATGNHRETQVTQPKPLIDSCTRIEMYTSAKPFLTVCM